MFNKRTVGAKPSDQGLDSSNTNDSTPRKLFKSVSFVRNKHIVNEGNFVTYVAVYCAAFKRK